MIAYDAAMYPIAPGVERMVAATPEFLAAPRPAGKLTEVELPTRRANALEPWT